MEQSRDRLSLDTHVYPSSLTNYEICCHLVYWLIDDGCCCCSFQAEKEIKRQSFGIRTRSRKWTRNFINMHTKGTCTSVMRGQDKCVVLRDGIERDQSIYIWSDSDEVILFKRWQNETQFSLNNVRQTLNRHVQHTPICCCCFWCSNTSSLASFSAREREKEGEKEREREK
jgi:hypothetical protein